MMKKLFLLTILFLIAMPLSPQGIGGKAGVGGTAGFGTGLLVVTDNFNRADAPTLGANWTTNGLFGDLNVVSNQAGCNNNVVTDIWTANSFHSDHFSKATFIAITNDNQTVAVRFTSGADTGYFAGFNSAFDATHYVMFKRVAGAQSQLGATTGTVVTAGDVVELDIIGTTLTLKVNSSTILTTTDASISGNSPGLRCSANTSTAKFDNWSGGNLD